MTWRWALPSRYMRKCSAECKLDITENREMISVLQNTQAPVL